MDQAVQQEFAVETQTLAKKSWTAYIKVAVITLVGMSIASAIFHHSAGVGVLLFLLMVFFGVYRAMEIKSVTLYYDDSGVWLNPPKLRNGDLSARFLRHGFVGFRAGFPLL